MIPFSNGSEYRAWRSWNCDVCKKDYDGSKLHNLLCPTEEAVAYAYVANGEISDKAYKFIGLDKGLHCPHREGK